MEANETLKRIREFDDNPVAMSYFYELYTNHYISTVVPDDTVPRIGTLCVQVPDELILATGARPLRLCSGAFAYDQLGAEVMPAKSCPLVKATFGMFQVKLDQLKKMKTVVIPTTCDQKKKAAEMLAASGVNITLLEMPPHRDSILGRTFWQESVKQFTLQLQKITGAKITSKALQKAIAETNRASQAYRELYALQQVTPPPLMGSNMLLVTNSYFFDEIGSWTAAVEKLTAELKNRQSNNIHAGNSHAPRLLITGSPSIFPNLKIPLLVEETGGVIVADEFCSSSRLLYDVPSYDETTLNDMVPAIADRYLKPCTCPCFADNSARQRKLVEMSDSFHIDGVIYQSFSGCMPYEMEQKQVNTSLGEVDIPMLSLETDYSPEDSGQLSTRVEAFLESIKARKRRQSKAA